MKQTGSLIVVALAFGIFMGATARPTPEPPKPVRWKHKCERPFNFDDLSKVIETREEANWELIGVSPVVMAASASSDSNAYLRYVACFKRQLTADDAVSIEMKK